MPRVVAIVHVYRHAKDLYVVPLVRLVRGPWLETIPMERLPSSGPDDLASALARSREIAGKTLSSATPAASTAFGRRLWEAQALCAVRWYADGTVKLVPQLFRILPEDGVEAGAWYDLSASVIEMEDDTPVLVLAERALECLAEGEKEFPAP